MRVLTTIAFLNLKACACPEVYMYMFSGSQVADRFCDPGNSVFIHW